MMTSPDLTGTWPFQKGNYQYRFKYGLPFPVFNDDSFSVYQGKKNNLRYFKQKGI